MTRMQMAGVAVEPGARACVGVIPMETYLEAIGEPLIYRGWLWIGVVGFAGMFLIALAMVTKMTPAQVLRHYI
ncbi:hypothetical protein [Pseudomonas taiwanensis]|uniref:hypothetical protein n=1 Tax=Pseudomonas taiwanensis TaxID=470150 RepID=UPI0036F2B0CE